MNVPYKPEHVTQRENLSSELSQFDNALKETYVQRMLLDISEEADGLEATLVMADGLTFEQVNILRGKIRGLRTIQIKIDAVREAFAQQLAKHDHA